MRKVIQHIYNIVGITCIFHDIYYHFSNPYCPLFTAFGVFFWMYMYYTKESNNAYKSDPE